MDIAYINLGETIKPGQVRYSLETDKADAPLTGYQLILIQDGPYETRVKIGEPMPYIGAYAAVSDINEAIIHCWLEESEESCAIFQTLEIYS